jgi:hypothetical protein
MKRAKNSKTQNYNPLSNKLQNNLSKEELKKTPITISLLCIYRWSDKCSKIYGYNCDTMDSNWDKIVQLKDINIVGCLRFYGHNSLLYYA